MLIGELADATGVSTKTRFVRGLEPEGATDSPSTSGQSRVFCYEASQQRRDCGCQTGGFRGGRRAAVGRSAAGSDVLRLAGRAGVVAGGGVGAVEDGCRWVRSFGFVAGPIGSRRRLASDVALDQFPRKPGCTSAAETPDQPA